MVKCEGTCCQLLHRVKLLLLSQWSPSLLHIKIAMNHISLNLIIMNKNHFCLGELWNLLKSLAPIQKTTKPELRIFIIKNVKPESFCTSWNLTLVICKIFLEKITMCNAKKKKFTMCNARHLCLCSKLQGKKWQTQFFSRKIFFLCERSVVKELV